MQFINIKSKINKAILSLGFISSMVVLLMGCDLNISLPSYNSLTPTSNLLKDVYKDYFSFGTAVTKSNIKKYSEILTHFNSVTAEYEMKWGQIEKKEGEYTYSSSDSIISWAKENDLKVRGHCLLWYKSLPTWVKEKNYNKAQALQAIDKHVKTTMAYYGDDVYCWDVLNEALKNSVKASELTSNNFYRTGNMTDAKEVDWYQIAGVDFVKHVFKSANEARIINNLEDVELFYNDYGLNDPNKREACVRLVKMLQDENIGIDGVGMQSHYRLSSYLKDKTKFLTNFEDSIKAFTELGVDVHITELDIRVFENDDVVQSFDTLPYEIEEQQGELYGELLRICREYASPWKEGAGKVTNVTVWGVADDSNSWSTDAHDEFPLLFNTEHEPKRAFYEIVSF